jgi:hypothetical protein
MTDWKRHILNVALLLMIASSARASFITNVWFPTDAGVVDIDWSHNHNFLAVGYLYEATGEALHIYRWQTNALILTNFVDTPETVTSVAWRRDANTHFAYGTAESSTSPELFFHAFNISNGKFSHTNSIELSDHVTIDRLATEDHQRACHGGNRQ